MQNSRNSKIITSSPAGQLKIVILHEKQTSLILPVEEGCGVDVGFPGDAHWNFPLLFFVLEYDLLYLHIWGILVNLFLDFHALDVFVLEHFGKHFQGSACWYSLYLVCACRAFPYCAGVSFLLATDPTDRVSKCLTLIGVAGVGNLCLETTPIAFVLLVLHELAITWFPVLEVLPDIDQWFLRLDHTMVVDELLSGFVFPQELVGVLLQGDDYLVVVQKHGIINLGIVIR